MPLLGNDRHALLMKYIASVSIDQTDVPRLIEATTEDDDFLLRLCEPKNTFATVQATCILRKTLHEEEIAIRKLTEILVRLTERLLAYTVALAAIGVVTIALMVWEILKR